MDIVVTGSARIHARIQQAALQFMDVLAVFQDDHQECTAVARPVGPPTLLECAAMIHAARHGRAAIDTYGSDKGSALIICTVVDLISAVDRPPVRWCPHRRFDKASGDVTLIVSELRYAGCAECVAVEFLRRRDTTDGDHACDVCGMLHEWLTPHMVTFGSTMTSVHTGECCEWLLSGATSLASVSYRGADRNAACPCGSSKKFKKCCLNPNLGR